MKKQFMPKIICLSTTLRSQGITALNTKIVSREDIYDL